MTRATQQGAKPPAKRRRTDNNAAVNNLTVTIPPPLSASIDFPSVPAAFSPAATNAGAAAAAAAPPASIAPVVSSATQSASASAPAPDAATEGAATSQPPQPLTVREWTKAWQDHVPSYDKEGRVLASSRKFNIAVALLAKQAGVDRACPISPYFQNIATGF